ncbi:gamma-glutamyltransferase, partial [Pseudomonas aeruginosa]|uniref:gamma-glutamyltransferase n=1 Tax=Pseudomonas aeruginosa TaxID=287 RepID=UPI0039683051
TGGNASHTPAAMTPALAVAEPYGSGLGGGGFFLLRQAGAQPTYRFLDARERAPKAAYADMYRRNGKVDPRLSVDGPLAAAIPGLPAALVELSGRYGRKPLADNLVPAIRLAVDGVSVDRIYRDRAAMRLEAMRKDPETARIFLDKSGVPDVWTLLL